MIQFQTNIKNIFIRELNFEIYIKKKKQKIQSIWRIQLQIYNN